MMKRSRLAERIEILERTATLVEAKADIFAMQAAEEGGKPLLDSRVELGASGTRHTGSRTLHQPNDWP